jgi:lipopolysaccharide transport protein LptA
VILANKTYLEFQGHQIKIANITGSKENQVILEFQRQEKDHITTAMADRIDYDFEAAMIDFSGNVTIIEDGNQISSNYLVYNIEQQSIQAQSNITDNPKVRITYTPRKIDDSNLNKEK